MRARTAVVLGEEELGVQRWCKSCQEWWPNDEEFFVASTGRDGYVRTWCRACRFSKWHEYADRLRRNAA